MADYSVSVSNDATERTSKNGSKTAVVNFDVITRRYRNLYKRSWADRSTGVKNKALERAIIEKCNADYTRDVFLQEFARRVDLLLDSEHFCKAVKNLVPPLDPYNVATHIVVLGWKEVEKVLLHEGYKYLKPYKEWHEPILTQDVLMDYLEHPIAGLIEDKRVG